ncbi:hypothetical protein [Mesorhizobium sp. CAU 1732]|uniref:hypothetical protein n=1 Tax=Mesorhizobium sp. CAU 1732 TaxID=3140358 RepID=UPI003260526C
MLKFVAALGFVLLLGVSGRTDSDEPAKSISLAVGSTGIFCVRAPCPWRGIADPDAQDPTRLLWSGDDLPPIHAPDDTTRRIERAWDDHECLLVEGAFDGVTLRVERIVGPCR